MAQETGEPATANVMAPGSPVLIPGDIPEPKPEATTRAPGEARWLAWIFLAPAMVLLLAVVCYPLIYTIVRSLFSDGPAGNVGSFTGLKNYGHVFTDPSTLRAVKNNVIWVVVAPTLVTIFGLVFAVLSERIRWATVFKTILFMPMAISFLATAVTFGLIYADQPSRGLANAVTIGIHDTFSSQSHYPNEHPRANSALAGSAKTGYTSQKTFSAGAPALLPMTGLNLQKPPSNAKQAALATNTSGLSGVVWNDFKLGGGGTIGKPDTGELGLPGIRVQALQNGKAVATATTDAHGAFTFSKLTSGQYQLKLPASNFG